MNQEQFWAFLSSIWRDCAFPRAAWAHRVTLLLYIMKISHYWYSVCMELLLCRHYARVSPLHVQSLQLVENVCAWMVSRVGRCAAGGFRSDFDFYKAITICRVRLRLSSYLLLLSVWYFLLSPWNVPSAMTGEVLGSSQCRRAPVLSVAPWSRPAGCWPGSARPQQARPGAEGRGSGPALTPQGCRYWNLLPPLPWDSALAHSGCTCTLQAQWGAPAAAAVLALCSARVFDRAIFSPGKTSVLSLLHYAGLKLFSCGLLSQSAGPICFLQPESHYLSSESCSRQVISLGYRSRGSKECLVGGSMCLGNPVLSEEVLSWGLLLSCRIGNVWDVARRLGEIAHWVWLGGLGWGFFHC